MFKNVFKHAEDKAGTAASVQNALDGCESLYVISSNKRKHDTNSNGDIAQT
jgi:hypothetical protein